MPEKFFYTFLILLIVLIGYFNAIVQGLEDTRPTRWLRIMRDFSWVVMVISAICWIWS